MHLPFLFASNVVVTSQLGGGGAGNVALTWNQSFPLFYWNENPSYKGPHNQSICDHLRLRISIKQLYYSNLVSVPFAIQISLDNHHDLSSPKQYNPNSAPC